MRRPPEFFQPTKTSAWVGFGLFFLLMAFFFPWLWGFLAGGVFFYVLFYSFYKMLGGK